MALPPQVLHGAGGTRRPPLTMRHALVTQSVVFQRAAEHGMGKIKRRWLPLQMNGLQIAMMTAVKRELDPLGILAPGNIL